MEIFALSWKRLPLSVIAELNMENNILSQRALESNYVQNKLCSKYFFLNNKIFQHWLTCWRWINILARIGGNWDRHAFYFGQFEPVPRFPNSTSQHNIFTSLHDFGIRSTRRFDRWTVCLSACLVYETIFFVLLKYGCAFPAGVNLFNIRS